MHICLNMLDIDGGEPHLRSRIAVLMRCRYDTDKCTLPAILSRVILTDRQTG